MLAAPSQAAPVDLPGALPEPPTPEDAPRPLEDDFLLAGLLGIEKTYTRLEDLKQFQSVLLSDQEVLHAAESRVLTDEHEKLLADQASTEKEVQDLALKREENATAVGELLQKYRRLTSTQMSLRRDLQAKRAYYPIRLIALKLKEYGLMSQSLADHLVSEEQKRLEYEHALHQTYTERRKLNPGEYEQRKQSLETRVQEAEERLRQAQARVGSLRDIGMSRKVAGFLIWAGYLSFAGFGWFAGESIKSLAGSGTTFLQTVFVLLAAGLRTLVAHLGVGPGILTLWLAPLLLIALLFATFSLADRFLTWFDPRWNGQGRSGRRAASQTLWGSFQNPARNVSRADYTQLMAKLPILYLWATFPALLAALLGLGGSDAANADPSILLSDPLQSFAYTFLGLVLCVALAAIILLYAVLVIGPRHRRYQADGGVTARDTVRMNIELTSFLVLLLIVAVVPDLLRTVFPGIPSIWQKGASGFGLWLLPFLGGFAVAYGILYKGLFTEQSTARRELQDLYEALEGLATLPIGESGEGEALRLRSSLDDLRQEIDHKWSKVDFWSRPTSKFNIRQLDWSKGLKGLLAKDDDQPLLGDFKIIVADHLLEPEMVHEFNSAIDEVEDARQALENLRERERIVEARLNEIKALSIDEKLAALGQEIADARSRHAREKSELLSNGNHLLSRCEGALRMGEFLRRDLSPLQITMSRITEGG